MQNVLDTFKNLERSHLIFSKKLYRIFKIKIIIYNYYLKKYILHFVINLID